MKNLTILFLCAAGLYAQSISFTAPASDGGTVTDGYTLTISTTSAPTIATVEYTIGFQLLGVVHASPWSLTYDFRYYFADGSILDVVATARDYAGAVVATATRRVRINSHSSNIVEDTDLTQTFSGTPNIYFLATSSGARCVDQGTFGVDGDNSHVNQTVSGSASEGVGVTALATTRYPNGTHEITITTREKECSGSTYYEWSGLGVALINIQNGHTLSEIIPTYEQILVAPSSPFTLGCKQVFTDDSATDQNSLTSCSSPSYSSSNTAVATVNSSTGVITGVAAGFATITISAHSKTASAHVWVRSSSYIPHFAKNGTGLRTSYLAGTSQFMVAPFIMLPSTDTSGNATHLSAVRRAAMTTATNGVWINPSDSAQNFSAYDYASWKATYDANIQTGINWAATNNFTIFATGDSGFKSQPKVFKILNWAHGQQALQYAVSNLASSGRAFSIDLMDESNGCYGQRPDPVRFIGTAGTLQSISCAGTTCTVTWPSHGLVDGNEIYLQGSIHSEINTVAGGTYFVVASATTDTFTFTPNSSLTATINSSTDPNVEYLWWQRYGCGGSRGDLNADDVLTNTLLTQSIDWIKTASSTLPISLPPLGSMLPQGFDFYGGKSAIANGMADYASNYWSDGEKSQPYGSSASSIGRQVLGTIYARAPYTNWDRPVVWITNMNSKGYWKESTNTTSYYDPAVDTQDTTGNVPPGSVIGVAVALAGLSSGIRPYNIHNMYDLAVNAARGVGAYVQTGAGPVESDLQGQRAFFATAHMTSLIRNRLEPFVLGSFENCIGLGRNTVTTCRSNAAGDKLVMIANMNDGPRTITVDLSAYKSSGVNISRYEVTALKTVSSTSSSATQTLSMAPGSVMFVICPVSSATTYVTSTALSIDTSSYPTTANIGVMTDHVFSETMVDRSDYTSCGGTACSVSVDRTQDVYYKYVLANSSGTPLFTSAPILLPALSGTSVSTRGAVRGRGTVKTR